MKTCCFLLMLSMGSFMNATAQTSRIPSNLYFLIGTWEGQGQFENGKKIETTIEIKLALDSSWLLIRHSDKFPGTYKSVSFWGIDPRSGQFLAFTFDNYLGHRNFVSKGWKKGKLILRFREAVPQQGQVYQQWVYEKLSDDRLRLRYEISRGGHTWPLIDSVVFTKTL